MKNSKPVILIRCRKSSQSLLSDYLIGLKDATVCFLNSENKKKDLSESNDLALLVLEIDASGNIPSQIISDYLKKTTNQDGPILFLTKKPIKEIDYLSLSKSKYFDVMEFPSSKEVFIKKIKLFSHIYRLQKNSSLVDSCVLENENNSVCNIHLEKQIEQRTEQLTKEITEHIKTKISLQEKINKIDESSYFQKVLVESIPIPLFIKNDKGIYLECNKAFEALMETSKENILGKNIFELTRKEIASKTHKDDQDILQTGESKIYEEDYRTDDGRVINLLTHKNAFDNKQNNTKGIIGAVVDITKVRRAERLLKIQHAIEYLASINKGITPSLKNILNQIIEIEWVDGGGIYLYDKNKKELSLVCVSGLSDEFSDEAQIYGENSPQMKLVENRMPIYENYKNPDLFKENKVLEDSLKFIAIIPLVNIENDEIVGCLNLGSRKYDKITDQEKDDLEFIVQSLVSLVVYAQTQAKIKVLNIELERKVKERTQNLQEINQRLSTEINYHKGTKELYRNLQNNIPIGIYSTTIDGNFVYLNRTAVEMFGYGSVEEMMKVPVLNVYFSKSKRNEFVSILKKKGSVKNVELECVRKDNSIFWGMIDVRTIYDKNGKIIQFDGVIQDITLRKEAELETKKAHNKIVRINEGLEKRIEKALEEQQNDHQYIVQKSKLESLGELAAGIAHEINQPLGVMALSFENLQIKIASRKATADYLQDKFNSIEENIKRIRMIIDHIRTFSRDQDSIALEKVNINNIVKRALSLIGIQYRNHSVSIQLNLEENIGFTIGSNIQVEQMVLNLLSNAKYAVEDKAAYINEADFTKEINIRTSCSDKNVILVIEDNGIGIDEENLSRIFDPFYTTKPEGFGTGLGLSLAYGIIKAMRGDIVVNSQKNEFTKFEILFPKFPEND